MFSVRHLQHSCNAAYCSAIIVVGVLTVSSVSVAQNSPRQLASVSQTQKTSIVAPSDTFDSATLLEPVLVGLSVVKSTSTTVTRANHGFVDIGAISPLDTESVSIKFGIRNDSAHRSVFRRVVPSCGCTSVTMLPQHGVGEISTNTDHFEQPIQPGEVVTFSARLSMAGLTEGSFAKCINIYTDTNRAPTVLIEIRGSVRASVVFEPQFVDFGHVKAGGVRSATVKAAVDNRLLVDGAAPRLTCGTPGITAVAEHGASAVQSHSTEGRHGVSVFTYRITVDDNAPRGPIRERMQLSVEPKLNERANTARSRASLLVAAESASIIMARPQFVAFGTVAAGRDSQISVVLYGADVNTFEQINVESLDAWMYARLDDSGHHAAIEAEADGRAVTRNLEIVLTDHAPKGELSGRVKIRLRNGEYILIPVTAFVEAR